MTDITFIKADAGDYDKLIDLWEASVTATHDFLTDSDIQDYKLLIRDYYFDMQDIYYVCDADQIQGFIGLKNDFIQMLFVSPALLGRGVGKELITFAIEEQGAKTVDVNEQNINAVEFYKRMGFETIGRSEMDAAGKPYPVLSMELS